MSGEIKQFSQKKDITDILNRIFNKPLNRTTQIIKNDAILNGVEFINTQTELKVKMGYFYEKLFCYFCHFKHLEIGFDLVDVQKQIYIELKMGLDTDKHNAKESKFRHFRKHKTNNPDTKIFYIYLND